MELPSAVLVEAEAFRVMVLWTEALRESLTERPCMCDVLLFLRRLLLWHFGRIGRTLRWLCKDRVRYVDGEAPAGGVARLGGLVILIGVAILAAEDLCLELLKVGALLRHGEQQRREMGRGGGRKGERRGG